MNTAYDLAKQKYAALGVDTEKALAELGRIPISMHCWQGDDVIGFENRGGLTGGIQTTGNYPGKARNPQELMADIEKALSLIPGKHRVNLHASYAVFRDGEAVDRDCLLPEHFAPWIAFAKERGLGLDFNPTLFSHPMAKSNLTLSSPDEEVRSFWVRHGRATRKIAAEMGRQLGTPCLHNIWIPDGFKDVPADKIGPRMRLKKSLDEIFADQYDSAYIVDSVESKVFGIGLEAFTVGSSEFYLAYAAQKGIYTLLDNGHYHPTEMVSDKIPTLLAFFEKVPLHVTRPMRWDSDHVVLLEDELREIAKEVVRNDATERVLIGLDYFDASINRVSAWVVGMRSMQKALLSALLTPWDKLRGLQDSGDTTRLMMQQEELKTYPMGAVWEEFCARQGVPAGEAWFDAVVQYENDVLSKRD